MVDLNTNLGIHTSLTTDMTTAETLVAEALKAEGFGILTEIDVKATLKNKLDVDFRPYKILGACNPSLAHRALTINAEVGLLLPCNIVLAQADNTTIEITAIDPTTMMRVVDSPEMQMVAAEAHDKLARVINSLAHTHTA